MADAQDRQRIADKLKNAFTIAIFSAAQDALSEKGIKLYDINPETTAPTYEAAKTPAWKRYFPALALGGILIVFIALR